MVIVKSFSVDESDMTIHHKRGDTAVFGIEVTYNGVKLTGYIGKFSVKQNLEDSNPLFEVPFGDDGLIHITHEMTKDKKAGSYNWDVEICKDGEYRTIGPFRYILLPDVTR